MNPFRDRWQIVYEVHANDQDRVTQFTRDTLPSVKPEQFDAFCLSAQKLFGRAYLVNLKTGMVRPVRMFDDAPGGDPKL